MVGIPVCTAFKTNTHYQVQKFYRHRVHLAHLYLFEMRGAEKYSVINEQKSWGGSHSP